MKKQKTDYFFPCVGEEIITTYSHNSLQNTLDSSRISYAKLQFSVVHLRCNISKHGHLNYYRTLRNDTGVGDVTARLAIPRKVHVGTTFRKGNGSNLAFTDNTSFIRHLCRDSTRPGSASLRVKLLFCFPIFFTRIPERT